MCIFRNSDSEYVMQAIQETANVPLIMFHFLCALSLMYTFLDFTKRKEMMKQINLWFYIIFANYLLSPYAAEIRDKNFVAGQVTWSGSLDQNIKGTYSQLR